MTHSETEERHDEEQGDCLSENENVAPEDNNFVMDCDEVPNECLNECPGIEDDDDDVATTNTLHPPPTTRVCKRKKPRKSDSTTDKILEYLNRKQTREVRDRVDDPDKLFLLSLLPELTNLNSHVKAGVKIRMQQLLFDAQNYGQPQHVFQSQNYCNNTSDLMRDNGYSNNDVPCYSYATTSNMSSFFNM